MARDTELHQRFLTKVKAYYAKLDGMREYGVKVHTTAYCIAKTADNFDRKYSTIENYIYS